MWRPFERLATGRSTAGAGWDDAVMLTGPDPAAPVAEPARAQAYALPPRAAVPARAAVATSETADPVADSPSPGRRLVVWVVAGPMRDLGAARLVSDALAGIEGVESISMTGDRDHRVQFEGWFSHERALVAELERVLPFAFEVESASGVELGLRLRAG
jgi:hypothetical protein